MRFSKTCCKETLRASWPDDEKLPESVVNFNRRHATHLSFYNGKSTNSCAKIVCIETDEVKLCSRKKGHPGAHQN